jgi:SAM-dependent methyltransferase
MLKQPRGLSFEIGRSFAVSREASKAFWDRVARRYADMPIRDPEGYERTLDAIRTRLGPSDTVLEVGCGTGTTALHLAKNVQRYVATDSSAEMIVIASEKVAAAGLENVSAVRAAPCDASMPEGPFDVVIAMNVVHLLPQRQAALQDIAGRLRRGGLFISKTPCLSGGWRLIAPLILALRLIGKAPAFRFLSPAKLDQDIQNAGFELIESRTEPNRPPRHFVVARKL